MLTGQCQPADDKCQPADGPSPGGDSEEPSEAAGGVHAATRGTTVEGAPEQGEAEEGAGKGAGRAEPGLATGGAGQCCAAAELHSECYYKPGSAREGHQGPCSFR